MRKLLNNGKLVSSICLLEYKDDFFLKLPFLIEGKDFMFITRDQFTQLQAGLVYTLEFSVYSNGWEPYLELNSFTGVRVGLDLLTKLKKVLEDLQQCRHSCTWERISRAEEEVREIIEDMEKENK